MNNSDEIMHKGVDTAANDALGLIDLAIKKI